MNCLGGALTLAMVSEKFYCATRSIGSETVRVAGPRVIGR
jgi:hypothetical protein